MWKSVIHANEIFIIVLCKMINYRFIAFPTKPKELECYPLEEVLILCIIPFMTIPE